MDQATVASLFVQATRDQYRYNSPNGLLNTEQLWQLPLTSIRAHQASLDDVARTVYDELQGITEKSFVTTKTDPRKPVLEAKLELVKFIIATKQAENAAKLAAREKAEKIGKLSEVLAKKQDAALENLSAEEIQKQIEELTK